MPPKDLRRDRQLRRELDEETLYYQHKSVETFNRDWTSITEKVAMWRIEHREWFESTVKPYKEDDYEDHDKGAAS